jgi:hypothetical protein
LDVIYFIYFRCKSYIVYNLNYIPTTLGVQSSTEIVSGGTQTKKKKRLNTVDLGCTVLNDMTTHEQRICENSEGSCYAWHLWREGLRRMAETASVIASAVPPE